MPHTKKQEDKNKEENTQKSNREHSPVVFIIIDSEEIKDNKTRQKLREVVNKIRQMIFSDYRS